MADDPLDTFKDNVNVSYGSIFQDDTIAFPFLSVDYSL